MNKKILKKKGIFSFILPIIVLTLFAVPMVYVMAQSVTITSSLDIGSTGSDVTTLQTFLARDSSIYPQGLVTGYFGPLTSEAVKKFQQRYSIDVVGRVGPITRGKVNELILSGGFGGSGGVTSGDPAPYIFGASSSSVTNSDGTKTLTLSWQTNESARGKVFYSQTPLAFTETNSPKTEPYISGTVLTDDTFSTAKSMPIANLQNNSTYYYMLESIDSNGNVSVTWPQIIQVK